MAGVFDGVAREHLPLHRNVGDSPALEQYSQTRDGWHLGSGNPLCGAVLCTEGRLAASLASTH